MEVTSSGQVRKDGSPRVVENHGAHLNVCRQIHACKPACLGNLLSAQLPDDSLRQVRQRLGKSGDFLLAYSSPQKSDLDGSQEA